MIYKKGFYLFIILLLGGMIAFPAEGSPKTSSGADLKEALQEKTAGAVQFGTHPETGKTSFIGTDLDHPIPINQGFGGQADAETAARLFLTDYGSLFGLQDQASELSFMKQNDLPEGRSAVRFQQIYQHIPVLGAEVIVNLNADQNGLSVGGEILPDIQIEVNPTISSDTALRTALETAAEEYGVGLESLTASSPELWIFNPLLLGGPGARITHLAWRVEVSSRDLEPFKELILVDAQRGRVLIHFNQVDTALSRAVCDNQNMRSSNLCLATVCTEGSCLGSGNDWNFAYNFAGDTYNFYDNYHSRNSLDGAGMVLNATVRFCSTIASTPCPYPNAFWNGSRMVYGQGYAAADDVVGHEMTHGVTSHESNLYYYYQSGAINESFSDLWGEFIDQTNSYNGMGGGALWVLGEDLPTGAGRSMQDPPLFKDPDRMGSAFYYMDEDDNGGVHYNSGVNNKAAYLLTQGGSFNGYTVSGLGMTKVAKIYYEVQTNLLTSGADYYDLYRALNQACQNLIGTAGITSADCQQVQNATLAVEMNLPPSASYSPDAQVCPAGQTLSNLFSDSFESGFTKWSFAALSGLNHWKTDDPYGPNAHSGVGDLFGDGGFTASDSYAVMVNSITLPANAFLHFYHTFDFKTGTEGGVLEYSANGGAWTDAGSLINSGKTYTGPISALGSRNGFSGDSHGYVSSRLSLNALTGQTIKFRWRMATDSDPSDVGWWVDDVNLYTCSGTFTSKTYLPLAKKAPPFLPLLNGDFEQGSAGWEQYSTHGWALIVNSSSGTIPTHSGSYAAWLGGGNSEISYLQQPVTVSLATPYLTYYHWIASSDICGYDFGGVLVNGTAVEVYNLCTSANTGGWVKHAVNLSAYAGQNVTLQIRVETDSSNNSNLFVDDAAFSVSGVLGPNLPEKPVFNKENELPR
jgi:bacillolysin